MNKNSIKAVSKKGTALKIKIAIMLLVSFVILLSTGVMTPTEVKAVPCWYYYNVTTNLNEETCCLEITITNPYGPCFEVGIMVNENGTLQLVDHGFLDYIDGTYTRTTEICAEDGKGIEWSFVVLMPQLNGPDLWQIYKSGSITSEEIAECKKANEVQLGCGDCEEEGCGPDEGWQTKYETITVPQYPKCPLSYKYEYRECCGERQVRGATISFAFNPYFISPGDCSDLYYAMTTPNGSGGGGEYDWRNRIPIPDSINKLFKRAFASLAEKMFMYLFNSTPPELQEEFFDCNNPNQGGTVVTYYNANCMSLFTGIYNNPIGNGIIIKTEQIKCNQTSCCREARHYCYDFENNKPVAQVDYSETGDSCLPNPVPNIPSQLIKDAIMWYQTGCSNNCGSIDK